MITNTLSHSVFLHTLLIGSSDKQVLILKFHQFFLLCLVLCMSAEEVFAYPPGPEVSLLCFPLNTLCLTFHI